jgi:pyrroline-5-carboxylate reductase
LDGPSQGAAATAAVDGDDRPVVRALFSACGAADEVPSEDQIDVFTAITGPVAGFVAFFADWMVRLPSCAASRPASPSAPSSSSSWRRGR